jgi:hypothetical protein
MMATHVKAHDTAVANGGTFRQPQGRHMDSCLSVGSPVTATERCINCGRVGDIPQML